MRPTQLRGGPLAGQTIDLDETKPLIIMQKVGDVIQKGEYRQLNDSQPHVRHFTGWYELEIINDG